MLKPVQTDFFKQSVFLTDKMISLNKIRQSCLTLCLRKLNRNYHISLNLHGISARSAFISFYNYFNNLHFQKLNQMYKLFHFLIFFG